MKSEDCINVNILVVVLCIVFQFNGGTGSTVHKICIISYDCICSYNLLKINLLIFKLIN